MSDGKQKKQTENKKQEEEYKDKYLRALADYHNLEKRIFSLEKETSSRAKKETILKLLPFLDNLDKAETFVEDPGLKLVKDQFLQVLASEGLEEMGDLVGIPFDPELAEAVEVVGGEADNVIKEVVQRGFKLHGKVVRPAKVKVTKKSA